MIEDSERIDVIILGRRLGTASGWDGDPGEIFWYYDFQASPGINLPFQDLAIDFNGGYIGTTNPDDGEFVKESTKDIIHFMAGVPRA